MSTLETQPTWLLQNHQDLSMEPCQEQLATWSEPPQIILSLSALITQHFAKKSWVQRCLSS